MKIAKYLFGYQGGRDKDGKLKPLIGPDGKKKEVDVSRALGELKDSILKIDDMLQLFPEEAKVEDMRKHLCDCLDEYTNKIHNLKVNISTITPSNNWKSTVRMQKYLGSNRENKGISILQSLQIKHVIFALKLFSKRNSMSSHACMLSIEYIFQFNNLAMHI